MPEVWDRFVGIVEGGKVHALDKARLQATMRALEGKRVEMAIRQEDEKRNLNQNAYLHVLARVVAAESGETLDRVKRLAVLESLGIEAGTEKETILGREITIVRRTSELRKDEASRLIDWMLDKCSFLGVTPPSREQVEAL